MVETERLARMGNVLERLLEKYTLSFLRTSLGADLFTPAGKLASKLPAAVAATAVRK